MSSHHTEVWRPVPGYLGYEASDQGRVMSRRRNRPRVLDGQPGPCGFRTANLAHDLPNGRNQRLGNLVALAFIGPPPSLDSELRRLDGDPLNDRPDNLAWGTVADVRRDHAARARREESAGASTHCPDGHRYADSWLANYGQRDCPTCRIASQAHKPKQRAALGNRQNRRPRLSVCVDCGITIENGPSGMKATRCPTHRWVRQQHTKSTWAKRLQKTREPRLSACVECGAVINNPRTGRPAKRCPKHRRSAKH
ncbi:NUMOD4 domain-containing protein [Nocardioides vastitatis]|uniref:NUMOD4 domain-containing protein n=1 Tax=Nocardioides vastitatis TaxID=2568655 RepID=A0ABW0ZLJ5_9ACTN|nr:hypothetical protein E7Z54_01510 [Nocardioides sp.]